MSSFPNPAEFCLKTSLYNVFSFELNDEDINRLEELACDSLKVDSYCIFCEKERVFKSNKGIKKYTPKEHVIVPFMDAIGKFNEESEKAVKTQQLAREKERLEMRLDHIESKEYFSRIFECSADNCHTLAFFFRVVGRTIEKVGQFPSLGDLQNEEISKYRKLLKDRYKELNKAIMLHSHDVGIGSFAYLRRIFESLVEEVHKQKVSTPGWNEDLYSNSRMAEKIDMLKDELPSFLVDNKSSLYGILSKSLHELSEEDCMNYFDSVKYAIKLILDQKLEEINKKQHQKEAEKLLQKINMNIKKNK